MTVTYSAKVATSRFGTFWKLLLRWRGSIYKLIWKEFTLFLIMYLTISVIYRVALPGNMKRTFEKLSLYCEMFNNLIPLSFVLGFYVSIVVSRWWEQFSSIPWPDGLALCVTANIHGHDDRGRLLRRTIMRYACLAQIITLTAISPPVKKRFPTFEHLTKAGLMTPNEEKILDELKTNHLKWFVPLVWMTSLVTRSRKENRIIDDYAVNTLIDEINKFRGGLGTLFMYDWVCVPLIYTQVCTLAVYTFFLSCLIGRQFLDPEQGYEGNNVDMYVPVFTLLQFVFYMGWLKVAESLVNPFGEDDDDFEMNWVIDRNLQMSYLIVDEMHSEHPQLIKDQYWDETDFSLPYTVAAEPYKSDAWQGSAAEISVSPEKAEFVKLDTIIEEPSDPQGVDIPVGGISASGPDFHAGLQRLVSESTDQASPEPGSMLQFQMSGLDIHQGEDEVDTAFGSPDSSIVTDRSDGTALRYRRALAQPGTSALSDYSQQLELQQMEKVYIFEDLPPSVPSTGPMPPAYPGTSAGELMESNTTLIGSGGKTDPVA